MAIRPKRPEPLSVPSATPAPEPPRDALTIRVEHLEQRLELLEAWRKKVMQRMASVGWDVQ